MSETEVPTSARKRAPEDSLCTWGVKLATTALTTSAAPSPPKATTSGLCRAARHRQDEIFNQGWGRVGVGSNSGKQRT